MKITRLHEWDVCYTDAVAIQKDLREMLVLESARNFRVRKIAGADISYSRNDDLFFAAVVVLDAETLEVIDRSLSSGRVTFPYIPGLLTFREGPVLLEAFEKLKARVDAVMFDGQGIAHPRRMGLASHMGLFLGVPTLGCAKKKLVGDFAEPGVQRGCCSELLYQGESVGAALRTKTGVKPVFVSPGHRMGLRSAIDLTLACCSGYRLPEPTRQAHLLVNKFRLGHGR